MVTTVRREIDVCSEIDSSVETNEFALQAGPETRAPSVKKFKIQTCTSHAFIPTMLLMPCVFERERERERERVTVY